MHDDLSLARGQLPQQSMQQWRLKQMATHTHKQAALRTEHAPQYSQPHPGAWYTIEHLSLEQDQV